MNSLLKISEIILYERKKRKWSQQLLADYAGLNRTTVGKIERNDYDDVGLRKIERILNLFNKSLMVADTGLPTLDQLKEVNNG
ncbi:helix-turn-helix transcriptional regulator [Vibrio sp. VB16]|uniref:helix-turn-helix transcriptional regulator n=1 Tax=Vibrio sp. VB16 TaxID=2785746 RepID=UPI00189F7AF8|nr:helix-turn-helix transcriptional regulator [Vibrio sp. VB16]UGA57345.1 helix-turn-helix domain-containing protein [Vibrio sp. VB16]